jgi:hypothetical protein
MPAFSFLRVLTLLALLLMPLAMAGQSHAVAAMPHHGAAMSAEQDCDRGGSPEGDERRQDGRAQCMMACAALPAWDAPPRAEAPAPRAVIYAPLVVRIAGLAPEAETPPPRIA